MTGASRSGDIRLRTRGRLPHLERAGGIYFITFRLADSLPAGLLAEWREKWQRSLEKARDGRTRPRPEDKWRSDRQYRRRVELALDKGAGNCWLRQQEMAVLTAEALKRFEGSRYVLGPWCVMPNHVHVLVRPLGGVSLSRILHSWKSFTAKEANRLLGRRGQFWQREYYDRLVRSERELQRCARYILANPARARLHGWQWVGEGDVEGIVTP